MATIAELEQMDKTMDSFDVYNLDSQDKNLDMKDSIDKNSTSTSEPVQEEDTSAIVSFFNNTYHAVEKGKAKALLNASKLVLPDSVDKRIDSFMQDLETAHPTDTLAGKILETGAQATTGLVLVRATGGRALPALAQGAIVDFTFFDENSGRISDVLHDELGVDNAVVNWLRTNKDDGELLGRAKNSIEGLGLGMAMDTAMSVFKYGKKLLYASKSPEDLAKMSDKEIVKETIDLVKEDAKRQNVAEDIIPLNSKESAENLINKEYSYQERKSILNEHKYAVDDPVKGLIQETVKMSDQDIQNAIDGVKSLTQTSAEAKRLADQFTTDAEVIVAMKDLAKDMHNAEAKYVYFQSVIANKAIELDKAIKQARATGYASDYLEVANQFTTIKEMIVPTKTIQATGARIPSAGRIVKVPEQVKAQLRAIDEIDNDRAKMLLERTISGVEFKKIDELIRKYEEGSSNLLQRVKHVDLVGSKAGNIITEVSLASMLSGYKTLAWNVAGGAIMKGFDNTEMLLASAFGKVLNSADRIKSRELKARLVADAYSTSRSISTIAKNIYNSFSGTDLKKFEDNFEKTLLDNYDRLDTTTSKALTHEYIADTRLGKYMDSRPGAIAVMNNFGAIARSPYITIGAIDDFFKRTTFDNEIAGMAVREADRLGLTGEKASEFVNDFVKANQVFSGMISDHKTYNDAFVEANKQYIQYGKFYKMAIEKARVNTFQEDLGTGFVGKSVNALNSHWASRFLIPFKKTPINILKQVGRRTPFSKKLWEDVAEGGLKRDMALARLTTGAMVFGTAYYYADSGMLTGSFKPEERNAMKLAGIPEYSIKIDGKWYEYKQLDPIATMFGLTADFVRIGKDLSFKLNNPYNDTELMDTAGDLMAEMMVGVSKNVFSKTYMKTFNDIIDMVEGRAKIQGFVVNRATALVPLGSGLKDVAELAIDPDYMKEGRDLLGAFEKRWAPALARDALDALGKPIPKQDYLLGTIKSSTPSTNPVREELARRGVPIPNLKDTIEFKGFPIKLTQEQFWEYRRSIDTKFHLENVLAQVISSQSYQSAGSDVKTQKLHDVISKIQQGATKQFIADNFISKIESKADLKVGRAMDKQVQEDYNTFIKDIVDGK